MNQNQKEINKRKTFFCIKTEKEFNPKRIDKYFKQMINQHTKKTFQTKINIRKLIND